MTLIARIRRTIRINDLQGRLIDGLDRDVANLKDEIRSLKLAHAREMHGLITAWLIALEKPETDMRETLVNTERALAVQVAVLEEHVL